ncbi:MAG: hypothetical protein D8M61_02315 [Ignavibacteriae bacterium]|nr:hypothetical protein [Ignavibacteriota bacterium]
MIKLDKNGSIIVSRGGYGWAPSTFDYPADVFAQTLRIAVADKNNNRIQFFDKDLTFLSEFNTKEKDDELYSFQYPTASAFSYQGDLFILDSDNSRILKYNLTGDFILEIGSYDAGDFSLNNPVTFAVSPDGKLFVINENKIILFDQFGTGLSFIDAGFNAENINITFNNLVINNSVKIKYADLSSSPVILKEFKPDQDFINGDIIEALLFESKLFILTSRSIFVFNKFKNDK